MCGLFGFSGKHPADLTKLRWLAVLNEKRGRDSTGVYSVKNNKAKEKTLYKTAVEASKFIMDENAVDAMRGAFHVVGHTRAKTYGVVSKETAHPFEYNLTTKVVGAHNGFITDAFVKRYIKEFELEATFPSGDTDVDSQIIFSVLSKTGADYKVLPRIEGGITTLYMAPDKYKDTIFAYKRMARDLHYGLTAEGIYISSEKEPLEIIGCHKVESMENDSVTIFKDGQVLDIVKLESPKIVVSLNQSRSNFGENATKEVKELFKDELPKESCHVSNYSNRKSVNRYFGGDNDDYWNYRSEKNRRDAKVNKNDEDYQDKLNLIIRNCVEEVTKLAPADIKTLVANHEADIGIDDLMDGLVFVELTASTNKETLAAWAVYDPTATKTVAAVTGVNGVAVLRYPVTECGMEKTLVLYDPIDSGQTHQFKVIPKSGRVMEVALEIPFQQKKTKGGSTDSQVDRDSRALNSTILDTGIVNEDKLLDTLSGSGVTLGPEKTHPRLLLNQTNSICSGRSEEQTSGVTKSKTSSPEYDANFEGVSDQRNRTFTREELKSIEILVEAKLINPNIFLTNFKSIKSSTEFTTAKGILNFFLSDIVKVEELLDDAALLKGNDALKFLSSKAIMYYAMLLLDYNITPDRSKYVHTSSGFAKTTNTVRLAWSYFKIQKWGSGILGELRIKRLMNAIEAGKLHKLNNTNLNSTAEVSEEKVGKFVRRMTMTPSVYDPMTLKRQDRLSLLGD